MQEELNAVENLTMVEGSVSDLLIGSPESASDNHHQFGKMQGIALGMSSFSAVTDALSREW
jgi:hypothetical protein